MIRSVTLATVLLFLLAVIFQVDAESADLLYETPVSALQQDGIIDRGPLSSVRVFDRINRAETLKVILRSQPSFASSLASISASLPPIALFSDVNQRAWYAPFVELGFRTRLIKGYPDGTFHPESVVTVAEAAVMLVRANGPTSPIAFQTSADLPNVQGTWFSDAVSTMISTNAIRPGSRLSVGKPMTRGELFDMVYRYRMRKKGLPLPSTPAPVTPVQPSGPVTVSTKEFAISIPSIGITDLTVSHPEDPYTSNGVLGPLVNGVGHLLSYPGDGSKIFIYGHSSGYPWDLSEYTKIFRGISKIEIGATVYVTYKGKLHQYRVTEKKTVDADDTSILEEGEDSTEQLLLYTCWPPDSVTQRYIVIAVPT